MHRIFAATALVSALLSSVAAASAAPVPFNAYNRTYVLGCVAEERPNASDKIGEFVIRNTTPHLIPRGSKIRISYRTQGGSKGTFVYDLHRDLKPGQSFEFNQQYRSNRCLAASATLPPSPTAAVRALRTKPNPLAKKNVLAR
jgi:hypothetical protein